ncbi:MAG: GyrI-like domain-containing protein [Crocinitomix sp.]|nr:GyrI-like domain-containing protein [Crocinitomix sp.]
MKVEIIEFEKLTLVGLKISTTLSEDNTFNLWNSFMKRRDEIKNRIDDNYYSIQKYPDNVNMDSFTPITVFDKWAAVIVNKVNDIPDGMEVIYIDAGKFAKFRHSGTASDFFRTSQYIYGTWLPSSGYELRNAHHFEIMEANYKGPNDPDSEEDVFIPLKT